MDTPVPPDFREWQLPTELCLPDAASLRLQLLERLAIGGPLVLEGSLVERTSTACVQVMLAAARSARAAGSTFELRAASSSLKTALADLGLEQFFFQQEI